MNWNHFRVIRYHLPYIIINDSLSLFQRLFLFSRIVLQSIIVKYIYLIYSDKALLLFLGNLI